MSEKLKQIMERAIKEEQYFHELYLKLADKVGVPSAKHLLLTLSEQEEIHKKRLESLDLENMKPISGAIESIDLGEELVLTPLNELGSIKEVFEFAIKNEIEANKRYKELAASIENPEAKNIFEMLASEEEKHESLLKEELKKLGL